MLDRESKSIHTGSITVIAGCINSKFYEIKIDVAVRISRVVNIRAGKAVIVGFDIEWGADTEEHPPGGDFGQVDPGGLAYGVINVGIVNPVFSQVPGSIIKRS
ncbi:hypothetical protein D3C80_1748270 [compost metagenome]